MSDYCIPTVNVLSGWLSLRSTSSSVMNIVVYRPGSRALSEPFFDEIIELSPSTGLGCEDKNGVLGLEGAGFRLEGLGFGLSIQALNTLTF